MHRYDLFDWIFEKQVELRLTNEALCDLAKISVQNGNLHSFIQLIDNGLILYRNKDLSREFVRSTSLSGFYRFTKFLFSLIESISLSYYVPLIYGSLSIFL